MEENAVERRCVRISDPETDRDGHQSLFVSLSHFPVHQHVLLQGYHVALFHSKHAEQAPKHVVPIHIILGIGMRVGVRTPARARGKLPSLPHGVPATQSEPAVETQRAARRLENAESCGRHRPADDCEGAREHAHVSPARMR